MFQYTSKFGPAETAYLVDLGSVTMTPVVVSEIFLKHSVAYSTYKVLYKLKSYEKYGVGKEISEDLLYTLDEAKALINQELAKRSAEINALA